MKTQSAAQTKIYDAIRKQVCLLIGWTELQQQEYMIKCGKQYLQAYIPKDPTIIDELIQSSLFWKWWQNNWYQRDLQFTYSMLGGSKFLLQLCYKELHDPDTLAKCIYPNGIVLEDSYAKMIGKVIKKEAE